jgi:hypothetical protein
MVNRHGKSVWEDKWGHKPNNKNNLLTINNLINNLINKNATDKPTAVHLSAAA